MSEAFSQIGSRTQMYTKEEVDRITKYPGEPLFTFSAISDIHLHDNNDDNGYDDLVNLFRVLGNRKRDMSLNLRYIFAAGDIGMKGHTASPGATHEIQTFSQIVQNKSPVPRTNVYSCNGNHDQEYTLEEWKEWMYDPSLHGQITDDKNIFFTDGNFVFAFMSLAQQSDRSTTVAGRICYLDDARTHTRGWLEDVVQKADGKTLILFMHYPIPNRKCVDTSNVTINQYDWATGEYVPVTVKMCQTEGQFAGLLDGGGSANKNMSQVIYGFHLTAGAQDYKQKVESEEIIDILKQHNGDTVVFSGHTHLVFEVEDLDYGVGKGYSNVNVAQIPGTSITTVHIPSLNHPRMLDVKKSLSYKNSSGATVSSDFILYGIQGWTTISDSNPYRQPCQSWLVDVYNDKLILRGFESNVCHDKKHGDVLDKYTYTIDLTTSEETDNG